jgi:hypothetical protein
VGEWVGICWRLEYRVGPSKDDIVSVQLLLMIVSTCGLGPQALQVWSRTALPDGATLQLDERWLDNIIWDPGELSKLGTPLGEALAELDLNNPRLVFEIPAGVDPGPLLERAAADIVVCEPQVRRPFLAP